MPWLHLPGPAGRRQAWPRPVRNVQKNNGVSALARAGRPKTGLAPASAQPTRCNNMPWLHLPGPAVRRQAWPRPVRNMQKTMESVHWPGPAVRRQAWPQPVRNTNKMQPKTCHAPTSAQHATTTLRGVPALSLKPYPGVHPDAEVHLPTSR